MNITPHSARPDLAAPLVAPATVVARSVSPTPADARRRLSSDALLGGGDEVLIEHRGSEYRLRLTALGKLILTK